MEYKMPSNFQISLALIISAAAGLIYEITATQILFFYFIESSYSLSIVISTFLMGLGIGSYGMYKYIEKLKNKRTFFGILQLVISIYSFFVLTNLSNIIPRISFFGVLLVSFLVLILPTIFLGAIFPLAASLYQSTKKENVGLVYALDLIGSVVGALLVGFFLIPNFGIIPAIIIGSYFNLISAFIILPRFLKILSLIIALIFLLFLKSGNIKLFPLINTSIPFEIVDTMNFQFFRNSPMGTVEVQNNTLYLNGKEQCSLFYPKNASERKIAEYALRPLIKDYSDLRVLNIGLGCGLTIGEILSFNNINLDVVEINPVVVEANKVFTETFKKYHFNLIIDDGFNFLRTSNNKYHAIIVDIEDPKVIHSSAIYTVEAFTAAKERLNDDGIFALWTYEPPISVKPKSIGRYLDILYYSLKKDFKYVYWYPRVFIATDRQIDGSEYQPHTPYEINTLNRNTISPVFDWF